MTFNGHIVGDATLYTGDALEVLRCLDDESVNCVVTSPPYYALRDYGVPATAWPACSYVPMPGLPPVDVGAMSYPLGLEPSVHAFIAHMVLLFREVRRILRKDGTLWLNMGDGYAGSGGLSPHMGAALAGRKRSEQTISKHASKSTAHGYKLKDLIGMPWMIAKALQADGWYLRSEIIWHKPAPMPTSQKDRPTTSHEHLFMLTRKRKYHYDWLAIAEPVSQNTHLRCSQDVANQKGSTRAIARGDRPMKAVAGWANGNGHAHDSIAYTSAVRNKTAAREAEGSKVSTKFGRQPGWRKLADHDAPGPRPRNNGSYDEAMKGHVPGVRNKRTVWTIPSEPYSDNHFATYPRKLVEPCILAGCPKGGVVLDLFSGTGTTGVVALETGRRYIGIELNPDSQEQAVKRLELARVPKSAKPKRRKRKPVEPQHALFN